MAVSLPRKPNRLLNVLNPVKPKVLSLTHFSGMLYYDFFFCHLRNNTLFIARLGN